LLFIADFSFEKKAFVENSQQLRILKKAEATILIKIQERIFYLKKFFREISKEKTR